MPADPPADPPAELPADLLAEELSLRAQRRPYASALVVWARSPTSGRAGDRALVTEDGRLDGWVGGSCSEPAVTREAMAALADGNPRMLHLGPPETVPPGREGVVAVPVACASEGELEVFVQPHLPVPRIVGVGRAPMLEALATMGRAIGYDAAVVERGPDELTLGTVDARSAVVVGTFGRYDEDALEDALATPAPYVGLVASAKRASTVFENLRDAGARDDQLARVRAPAGLDLGSLEHSEIAVAVLADIVTTLSPARAAAAAPSPPPAVGETVDPVCGMSVDRASAADRATYDGVEYAFCCAGCRRRFETDPAAVLSGGR